MREDSELAPEGQVYEDSSKPAKTLACRHSFLSACIGRLSLPNALTIIRMWS